MFFHCVSIRVRRCRNNCKRSRVGGGGWVEGCSSGPTNLYTLLTSQLTSGAASTRRLHRGAGESEEYFYTDLLLVNTGYEP